MYRSDSDDADSTKMVYVNPEVFLNRAVDIITVDSSDDSSKQEEMFGMKLKKPLRDQDMYLPIASIAKIMKKSVPDGAKMSKDAQLCIQECVSEFISFITSEANDRCTKNRRKTINGEDIIYSMRNLGFDNYVEPLTLFLQKYRKAVRKEQSI